MFTTFNEEYGIGAGGKPRGLLNNSTEEKTVESRKIGNVNMIPNLRVCTVSK
jgi:hypothetical protein